MWRRNGRPLELAATTNEKKYAIERVGKTTEEELVDLLGSRLVINKVDKLDEGKYSCLVETRGSHRLIERESPAGQLIAAGE